MFIKFPSRAASKGKSNLLKFEVEESCLDQHFNGFLGTEALI